MHPEVLFIFKEILSLQTLKYKNDVKKITRKFGAICSPLGYVTRIECLSFMIPLLSKIVATTTTKSRMYVRRAITEGKLQQIKNCVFLVGEKELPTRCKVTLTRLESLHFTEGHVH